MFYSTDSQPCSWRTQCPVSNSDQKKTTHSTGSFDKTPKVWIFYLWAADGSQMPCSFCHFFDEISQSALKEEPRRNYTLGKAICFPLIKEIEPVLQCGFNNSPAGAFINLGTDRERPWPSQNGCMASKGWHIYRLFYVIHWHAAPLPPTRRAQGQVVIRQLAKVH